MNEERRETTWASPTYVTLLYICIFLYTGARAQGTDTCAEVTVSGASSQATTIELPASDSLYENQLAGDSTARGQYVNEDAEYFIW